MKKQYSIGKRNAYLAACLLLAGSMTVPVMAETEVQTETAAKDDQTLYDDSVKDAMIIDSDEILPVVSLEKGEPYAVYNEDGKILLFTLNKYPESYPDGADVELTWGNVWTFAGGEMKDWYDKNKDGVTDWQHRMVQLLGMKPDDQSGYVTAMWADPQDVFRPAYETGIGTVDMTDSFSDDVSEEYKEWFDGNIISSYFDDEYPWTRLGYTYDWADNGQEYGLSEFIIKGGSKVQVAYTVTVDDMIKMFEEDSWNPETEEAQK